MKTLKKNISLRESSQGETNLEGGAVLKAERRLTGEVGLAAHLMADKLAGLPEREMDSPQVLREQGYISKENKNLF